MRFKSLGISLLAACSLLAVGCTHHKHDEEKISLDQAPAAAQAGIKKQLGSATVERVERETKKGQTVYEVHAMRDGKHVEFKVDGSGALVGAEKVKGHGEKDADEEEEEHEGHEKGGHHEKENDKD